MVTTEIAADEHARELLTGWAGRGACEVGSHLHPWSTPPFADRPGLRSNDPVHAFPCQLPDELLHEKLVTLTEQVTAAFGAPPTSYRAGRFGFDARSAAVLAALGYEVDFVGVAALVVAWPPRPRRSRRRDFAGTGPGRS